MPVPAVAHHEPLTHGVAQQSFVFNAGILSHSIKVVRIKYGTLEDTNICPTRKRILQNAFTPGRSQWRSYTAMFFGRMSLGIVRWGVVIAKRFLLELHDECGHQSTERDRSSQ
jgi:hypothetical protein